MKGVAEEISPHPFHFCGVWRRSLGSTDFDPDRCGCTSAFQEDGYMKVQLLVVVKIPLLGVVLALAGCGGPAGSPAAKAGWEYTKWGMTPQEVVSASKNLATPGTDLAPDGDGNVSKLVAPYVSGKFSFRADFGFNAADRLASVTLVLDDKSAQMVMDSMNMSNMNLSNMNMDLGVCHDLQMGLNAAYGLADHGGTTHL